MTSLEDKLLGEKREYYCSSSESEQEEDADDDGEDEGAKMVEKPVTPPPIYRDPNGSTNTGPKGVIKDWQRYKQLEAEQRAEKEKEKLALIQKLSMTCQPASEDDDPDLQELLDDSFILEYSRRRMEEMFKKISELPQFGKVIHLNSGTEFLDAIEKENKNVTVIIHIFEERAPGCKSMNDSLNNLSSDHPHIKFCKMLASVAGMSSQFKVNGVPALLVYKNNMLVGNFINVTQELGKDFEAADVENFLIENGIMNDSSCVPSLLKK